MSVQNNLQRIVVLCVVVIVVGVLIFIYTPSERLKCFKNNYWDTYEDIAWKIDEMGKCVEYSTIPLPR